mmetsp:Transcript_42444/g.40690  ORF Transcript_42444/g.40690 Transcript_42444/m.40690 type:complete len:84 (+) Transcript_42444:1398-1649(+)
MEKESFQDKKGARLNLTYGNDDFEEQAKAQMSSKSCKYTCDRNKICPELMPTNCDDFYDQSCNCTLYCKKMVKFISSFIQDET